MLLPTMFGSALNRVSHRLRLMTATFGPCGRSSSAEKLRPSTKGAPISLKKSADTRPERSCSGKLPPV
jgi:hypothetical protein